MESIGDAFAFVDIEEPMAFEIRATSGEDSSFNFGERYIFLYQDGNVPAGGRVAGNAVIGRDSGDFVFEGIEREFRQDGCCGKARRFGDERMDLPEQTDFLVAEDDFGAPCGVEAGVGSVAFEGDGEIDTVGDLFKGAFEGEKVSG